MKHFNFTIEIWNTLDREDIDEEIEDDEEDEEEIDCTDTICGIVRGKDDDDAFENLKTAVEDGTIDIPYCHSIHYQDLDECEDDTERDPLHILPDAYEFSHPRYGIYIRTMGI